MFAAINTTLLKYAGLAISALLLLSYIYVLRADNNALEASVEMYKHEAQHNALIANQNSEALARQKASYEDLMNTLIQLEDEVAEAKSKQNTKEIEVVKYVSQLPEGFEKQCLNMPVPAVVGRMQK